MTSISQSIQHACQLIGSSSPSARLDAETLLCHVLQCNTAHLAAWPEKSLGQNEEQRFNELVQQRAAGRPVAYLTGRKEFWSLELKVNENTLIPRPETELLVETVLETFSDRSRLRLVDLGTGSGAIAIALAHEKPDWDITATDITSGALAIATENADTHDIETIDFIQSNWFASLTGETFDIIVSNPPYIAEQDRHLELGDLRSEPRSALASGEDGMDDIERIVNQSIHHLNEDGWLFLEHGYDQKKIVFDCLANSGFTGISQRQDLSGNPRLSFGQYRRK